MANPSKPSTVKLGAMQDILADLQGVQYTVQNPPYDSFDSIRGDLTSDLKGMMENVAEVAGQKYGSSLQYVDQGWRDVTSGVNALGALLTTTITSHGNADSQAADNATATNTSTTTSTSAGRG